MWEYIDLIKAENPEAYKKLAEKGTMVAFPAKIRGQSHRSDIGIPYHSTIKFFNPEKDSPKAIHSVASKLSLNPPDPKNTRIEPGQLKDRFGNDVYVVKLHGPHAEEIKSHNSKFSHMGYPSTFSYEPHISVDKKTWDNIVASKAKTAHEAGIEFGHAELRQGHNVLARYHPHKKLAASEDMQKSVFRNMGTLAAMTAGLASPGMAPQHQTSRPLGSSISAPQQNPYSSNKMLNAIAQVESSGGKNVNHAAGGGPIHGSEHAYGKYGLMPQTIRETIRMNRDLASVHGKAMRLKGPDLSNYMRDNPKLEDAVAQRHLRRLEHHFGQDKDAIAYGWLNGITGTAKAKKEKKDISTHWHVQKVKDAYSKEK